MTGRLADKHALVTGGTQGIGEGIVRAFVAEGARVVTVARNADRGDALVRELGPALAFRAMDITDDAAWQALAADHDRDPFDVLVNNAGGLRFPKPLIELDPAEWRLDLEINLTGPFLAIRYLLPSMRRRRTGSIINIASMSGLRAQRDATAYQAAKAGLRWLTKNAAITYAADGIRVNAINPGVIATEAEMSLPSERERSYLDLVPMGRRGTPADVAWAAVYLAKRRIVVRHRHRPAGRRRLRDLTAQQSGRVGREPVAFVDAHHHLWDLARPGYPWLRGGGDPGTTAWIGDYAPIRRSFVIEDYLAEAQPLGLAKSVHVEAGWGTGDSSWESRWLQELADRHGFPHAIVASVDLSAPNAAAQLDRHLLAPNFRGVRTIRMGGFSDRPFRRGFAALAERGLVYDANLRLEHANDVIALAEAFPATTIAVDNMANPATLDAANLKRWMRAMRPLGAIPNVLMKVSGHGMADHHWTTERIRPWVLGALEIFSSGRCMFGSNWPVDRLYGSLASVVDAIRSIVVPVSAAAADEVLRTTAERCYRI